MPAWLSRRLDGWENAAPAAGKHGTVHSVPSNTLRDAQKRQKTPFRVAILGVSVTSAALHSQKTPRGILPVNSNENTRSQPENTPQGW